MTNSDKKTLEFKFSSNGYFEIQRSFSNFKTGCFGTNSHFLEIEWAILDGIPKSIYFLVPSFLTNFDVKSQK